MIKTTTSNVFQKLAMLGGALVVLISFITTADIIGRELFGLVITGVYEIVRYLMVFVVFLALAYVESKKGNVQVEIISKHYPKKFNLIIDILTQLLSLVLFAIMFYGGFIYFINSLIARETMTELRTAPLYIWKIAVPVGCLVLMIQLMINLINDIHLMRKGG